METVRFKVVEGAKVYSIELKQTYAKEGLQLSFKAGRYTHARQYKRMRKAINRQRTIVARLQREVIRKMKLPLFHGHLTVTKEGVRDAQNQATVTGAPEFWSS